VNRIFSRCDERLRTRAQQAPEGISTVKTVRPDKPEPIPVHAGSHRMGSVIVRFLVLAAIIAAIVLSAWLR
jgi:hypothetical protein